MKKIDVALRYVIYDVTLHFKLKIYETVLCIYNVLEEGKKKMLKQEKNRRIKTDSRKGIAYEFC